MRAGRPARCLTRGPSHPIAAPPPSKQLAPTASPQHTPDARPQQHSIADDRVAHALAGSGAAQSHVVQHGHIVAHNGCLANHDACGKGSDGREGRAKGREGVGAGQASNREACRAASTEPEEHKMPAGQASCASFSGVQVQDEGQAPWLSSTPAPCTAHTMPSQAVRTRCVVHHHAPADARRGVDVHAKHLAHAALQGNNHRRSRGEYAHAKP